MILTKKSKKIILWCILPFVALFMVISLTGTIILNGNQTQIRNLIETQFDENMSGWCRLNKISLSIFANFPHISLELNNVALGNKSSADTLINIKKAFISLDIASVIKSDYKVNSIIIKDSRITATRDSSGIVDIVRIFEPSEIPDTLSSTDTSFKIDLKDFFIENIRLSFTNSDSTFYEANIERFKAALRYNDDLIGSNVNGRVVFTRLPNRPSGDNLPFTIKGGVEFNKIHRELNMSELCIQLGNIDVDMNGKASLNNDGDVDITFSTMVDNIKSIGLDSKNSIPRIKKSGKGVLDLKARIEGKTKHPLITGSIDISNINWQILDTKKFVNDIGIKAKFNSGVDSLGRDVRVSIDSIHMKCDSSLIHGSLKFSDLTNPKLNIDLRASLDLNNFNTLVGNNFSNIFGGKVDFSANAFLELDIQKMQLAKDTGHFDLSVKDFYYHPSDSIKFIDNITGKFHLSGDSIVGDDMIMVAGRNVLKSGIVIKNLTYFLFGANDDVDIDMFFSADIFNPYRLMRKVGVKPDSTVARQTIRDLKFTLETCFRLRDRTRPLSDVNNYDITLFLKDFGAKYPGVAVLKNFSGELDVKNDTASLRNFMGTIGRSSVNMNISIPKIPKLITTEYIESLHIPFTIEGQTVRATDIFIYDDKFMLPNSFVNERLNNLYVNGSFTMRPPVSDPMNYISNMSVIIDSMSISTPMYPLPIRCSFDVDKINDDIHINKLHTYIGNSDFNISGELKMIPSDKDTIYGGNINVISRIIDINQLMSTEIVYAKPYHQLIEDSVNNVKSDSLRNLIGDQKYLEYIREQRDQAQAQNIQSAPSEQRKLSSVREVAPDATNIFDFDFPDLGITAKVGQIKYMGVNLDSLAGYLRVNRDKRVVLDSVKIRNHGGIMKFNGVLDGANPEKIGLKSEIDVRNIRLDNLGLEFVFDDNTDPVILSDHFHGIINGVMNVDVTLTPELDIIMKDVYMDADISFKDGAIINFAPIKAAAKYFRKKDLNNIRFAEIKNRITVKDGIVSIPRMNIASTIGNFFIEGTQTFDGVMDFSMEIPWSVVKDVAMSTIFGGKKKEDVDDEIQEAVAKKTIKVGIKGTPDNFDVKIGKKRKENKNE